MTRDRSGRTGSTTLHRVWTGTVVRLLVLMVGVGMVAIGAAQYQRTAAHDASARMTRMATAQAALSSAILGVNDVPSIGMMYGTGHTVAPATLLAGYQLTRAKINAAFDNADRVMTDAALTPILKGARQTWLAMDAAILAAPALVASGALDQALAKGQDPNKTVIWDRYAVITVDFSTLATAALADFRQSAAQQDRTQLVVVPVIVGSLLVGLLLGFLAIRRMKREVLTPILELRRAALTMRDSKLDHRIELNGGTIELRDLATTLNEASVALGATHRVLRDQAYTDALTGLANRKAFTEHLNAKLSEEGDRRIGVLFIDLDDFKDINDTLGHAAGDELLSVVAQRLRHGTRQHEFIARLGGDEFAIVVDCADRPGEALVVAERVVSLLSEPVRICETTATISCSVGIATSDSGAGAAASDELVRNADFAMYMAKSQGKNRFEVFAPTMHNEMLSRLELKRDLATAVELDQLVLHYQPVLDLASGVLRGFEALVRWQHPTRGLLAPGHFIALAEDSGEIVGIGTWVLDRACAQLAELRRDCHGGSSLRMAINVSAHQINGQPFVDIVKATLDRHGIPANAITLEITEAVALTNTELATQALTALRSAGVLIALDDFGVGYSSLRYLHELPIDVIKIDRSFVMDQDGETDSMLQALVALGQNLGLEIIAEGIEKPSELQRLRRFHDIAGQGYLFAKPMPASDATMFARSAAIVAEQFAAPADEAASSLPAPA